MLRQFCIVDKSRHFAGRRRGVHAGVHTVLTKCYNFSAIRNSICFQSCLFAQNGLSVYASACAPVATLTVMWFFPNMADDQTCTNILRSTILRGDVSEIPFFKHFTIHNIRFHHK